MTDLLVLGFMVTAGLAAGNLPDIRAHARPALGRGRRAAARPVYGPLWPSGRPAHRGPGRPSRRARTGGALALIGALALTGCGTSLATDNHAQPKDLPSDCVLLYQHKSGDDSASDAYWGVACKVKVEVRR